MRLLVALSAWLPAAVAFAHAAPQVLQVVWRDDGGEVLLVTNRGLAFGKPDGSGWRIMCNEALHITVSEQPSAAYLTDGRLLVGTSAGLQTTSDQGCNWQGVAPFATLSAPAIAKDPAQPGRVYVAVFGTGQGGIYVTEDAAASFTQLMPAADDDFLRSLLVAPQHPAQLYAAGSVFDAMGNFKHYVARSMDSGKTWERFDVPVLDQELDVRLLAISPADPNVLLAKATGANPGYTPERLLLSRDGGKTFTSPFSTETLLSAAFSADGSTAWVAGLNGLYRSIDGLQTFAPAGAAVQVTYVAEHQGMLWAGGYYEGLAAQLDGLGLSADGGDSFQPWMAFMDIADEVGCGMDAPTTMLCDIPFRDWQHERSQFGNGSAVVMPMDPAGTMADAGAASPSGAGGASTPVATGGTGGTGVVGTGGNGMIGAIGTAGAAATNTGGHHSGCAVRAASPASLAELLALLLLPLALRRRRS